MASTLVIANVLAVPYRVIGNQKKTVVTVTPTGTYATGGEALSASQLGLNIVEYAEVELVTGLSEALPLGWAIWESGKVKLFNGKTNAELANGSTITGVVLRIEAFGW